MLAEKRTTYRYSTEAELLKNAVAGGSNAAHKVIQYLCSASPALRQIMIDTLHDLDDPRIWRHLLSCLAIRRWEDSPECERLADPQAAERLDASIADAFILDESPAEREVKETVLRDSLAGDHPAIHQAAAFLLGLRGEVQAIPALAEMVETGEWIWQLRAVQALGAIKDERSGFPLIRALEKDREHLHQAARRSLWELGPLAELAFQAALNHPDSHIRWHAARGLGEIGDSRAVRLLAEGLRDENHAVRWASARVLAQMDAVAVPAILRMLTHYPLTEPFRAAAHHALNSMNSHYIQKYLQPLLNALHSPSASMEAPAIAQQLLSEWKVSV